MPLQAPPPLPQDKSPLNDYSNRKAVKMYVKFSLPIYNKPFHAKNDKSPFHV